MVIWLKPFLVLFSSEKIWSILPINKYTKNNLDTASFESIKMQRNILKFLLQDV